MNFSRVEWLVDIIDGKYRKIPRESRPEDNWVWSPQGVIDMHRPERWGYVQFSTTPRTARAIWYEHTQRAREDLMGVYYRQQTYRRLTGRYARSAAELGLGPPAAAESPVEVTPTESGYTATVHLRGGRALHVREDSKVWQDEPEAK